MDRILGLDVGIGSVGWAVVEIDNKNKAFDIFACGARCFNLPEVPKTKALKNTARRQQRGQRKRLSRRRQRLAKVKNLLTSNHLPLPKPLSKATIPGNLTARQRARYVWHLHAEALDRLISGEELARILLHIAGHRGFKSNSKKDRGDNTSDGGKMLRAVRENQQKALGYRTVGEMFAKDPAFEARLRNTGGDYRFTIARDDFAHEIDTIFDNQQRLGSTIATTALKDAYAAIAFHQLPLQNSIDLVGECRLIKHEKRAAKASPSFERFRYLSNLNNQTISAPGQSPRNLTSNERRLALELFAQTKTVTYKKLRKTLKLDDTEQFDGLTAKKTGGDAEQKDFAKFPGSSALRELLGDDFFRLLDQQPAQLDSIINAIVFNEDPQSIEISMRDNGVSDDLIGLLMDNLANFALLKGAGHLSSQACRRLIPHMEKGALYSQACELEGFDHSDAGIPRIDDIKNPVVRRVLTQALKQIGIITKLYGPFTRIHIELARDVGKGPEERKAIDDAYKERASEKAKKRGDFLATFERDPNDEDLLRYELYCERAHCIYCDKHLPCEALKEADNRIQVDHILPRSRSGDNSYHNKTLACTRCNQEKSDKSPFEWFGHDADAWHAFEVRVRATHWHRQKIWRLLNKTFKQRADAYMTRHLNDTRFANRVLHQALLAQYPTLKKRQLFTRPGKITSIVRRAWGLDHLKQSGELGDRDHALDALIVACTTDATLNSLTRVEQWNERHGLARAIPHIPTPLDDDHQFRRMLRDASINVFVSRPEIRRTRGPAHRDGLFSIPEGRGGDQYERKPVHKLTPKDLDLLKGPPERNAVLRACLEHWLASIPSGTKAEKFFAEHPPRMPKHGETFADASGPAIRHVSVKRSKTAGVIVRRGDGEAHADNEMMIRTDLFRGPKGFYLVPVYTWQYATRKAPPNKAIIAYKREEDWLDIDQNFRFRFSLFPDSYLHLFKRDRLVAEGYFRGTDISVAAINISRHDDNRTSKKFGVKTLSDVVKFHVSRTGEPVQITEEPRLWHGEVCS